MRLFEITASRRVLATSRFKKELLAEMRANASAAEELDSFLAFRESARPDAAYSPKDYAYRFGALKGYRHCHLVYGKSIVIYQVDSVAIYLSALVDHSQYDGHNPKIAPFLSHLSPSDYVPFDVPKKSSAVVVEPDKVQDLKELIYDLTSGEDREILMQVVQGNFSKFVQYTQLLELTNQQVAAAFGSIENLVGVVKKALADTRIAESQRFRVAGIR